MLVKIEYKVKTLFALYCILLQMQKMMKKYVDAMDNIVWRSKNSAEYAI